MYDYNLIVIGAGSAGLVASYVAAASKAKVALIERNRMGGDCLNTGCVPSKALIRSASVLRDAKRAKKLGFRKIEVDFDFAEIMERVQRVIKAVEPHDSVERYSALGVECISGEAKVVSPHEVEVDGKTFTTRSIIVASGARPFVPPIKGLDQVDYRTSDTFWDLRKFPKRSIVIGGGPIGSELSQCLAYLGSEVTQIEHGSRIMSREDEDVARIVMDSFKDAGVRIETGMRASEVQVVDGENRLICQVGEKSEVKEFPFDLLLLAVGRAPNGNEVGGLSEVGVEINKRGAIVVDEYLQTTVPGIYACGDVVGSYQFTHTAGHAGVYAALNSLYSPLRLKVDWSVVPWCTFTHPEVARVGLSEQEAQEKEIAHEVTKYGIDDLDRAIADEEAEGFVKLLTPPGSDKLLGVTIVGHHAGDLLHEYIVAMRNNLKVGDILKAIHIYPTLAEANKFAASEWKKAHLSKRMLGFADWLNTRRRT